jgi:beta-galactosidase
MKKIFLMMLFCSAGDLLAQEKKFLDNINYYIENTQVYELNQEEGHTHGVPYSNIQQALKNFKADSPYFLSLNGAWKFNFSNTPQEAPQNFFLPGFDDKKWSAIQVPSNWEMQGFGDPQFRNIAEPFKSNPPFVPDEYNPTGAYRQEFNLPDTWKERQVFLRMEKTASASFVWVNGKEVGYNEGAQEPAEYNITKYLKPGRNVLAVLVIKYSDGVYLEDQDYWRLAGIFDDVSLFATPAAHISDWYSTTDLDAQYKNATWNVTVNLKNYSKQNKNNYSVRLSLLDKNEKIVDIITSEKISISELSDKILKFSRQITNPLKWSAEHPDLYKVTIELLNSQNIVEEVIGGKIGFKETEIRHQVFYLNGVAVKLNGINTHMQHPVLGHSMNEETMQKDFKIFKQFNINCVRTSHYPPVIRYLELADEYGIYIIDETGDESHSTEYLSDDPKWIGMYRERVRKMVLRDRNHPSILFWSAGNESGEGKNICEVIDEGKKLDPSRSWMYGGNAFAHPCEEIIGPRYPTPFDLKTKVGMIPESEDPRPSFMDEYISLAGNGGGGLDEYWDVIYSYPRIMGGALWDFVSPGLQEKARRLKDSSPQQVPAHIMGRAKLTTGKVGKGLDLNGHDQWVEIYEHDALEISGDQLTMALWVFPRALNYSSGALLNKGDNQFGLQQIGNDSLEFYITTKDRYAVRAGLPKDWQNKWHHIAGTYDGNKMTIFIDGIELKYKAVSGNILNVPFPVNIGRNEERHGQDTDVYTADAIVDQVAIFSKVVNIENLIKDADDIKQQASLWLDFEEEIEEGNYFSYGIGARTYGSIWPNRKAQPEMWQIKKSGQPVIVSKIDEEKKQVEIWNRFHFSNLNELNTKWVLEEDGATIDQGLIEIDLLPLNKKLIDIPFKKPSIKPGAHYRLLVSFQLKENKPWAAAGFEIAWDQLELPWYAPIEKVNIKPILPSPKIIETPDLLIINGKEYEYSFDKKTGKLSSMKFSGKEILKQGGSLNIWRAPLANEKDAWTVWASGITHLGKGMGYMVATEWYTMGIDHTRTLPEKFSFTVNAESVDVAVKEITTFNNGNSGFESQYTYNINGEGKITLHHTIIPSGLMPVWIPRMGMQWQFDQTLQNIQWYGRGPQENYPDRKTGYKTNIYSMPVNDMYEPYILPEDFGLRSDNYWVKLIDKDGIGLKFSGDQLFNFNAYTFSTDNLSKAKYIYQLKPSDRVTLNLDYQTSGVGCTAISVLNQYRTIPARMDFTTTIIPVKSER